MMMETDKIFFMILTVDSPSHNQNKMLALERPHFNSDRLQARWLGLVPYEEAYQIQRLYHARRHAGEIPDQLLLIEHPTVFTIPRRSEKTNILVSEEFLRQKGALTYPTDRGGEITLHNPGQLVGYLICRLEPGRGDLHAYLRWIEHSLQLVAARFGVETCLRQGYTGVWSDNKKLASIGIAVKRWVTLHGFGLNASNDLEPFTWVHPCGLVGVQMTSLEKEAGHSIPREQLLGETCRAFGAEWLATEDQEGRDFPVQGLPGYPEPHLKMGEGT